MMNPYIRLLRPTHWVKNLLLFGGLVFGGRALETGAELLSLAAFAVFCALSSFVYVLNDLRDRERDRAHPLKSKRPLASGEASVGAAWALAAVLLIIGGFGAWKIGQSFAIIGAVYIINNLLYSLGLKRFVIIDVMMIAFGFVLRAWAGAVAIGVDFDTGLSICTFLLALFLGFGKRRHELVLLGDGDAGSHRLSLHHYSPYFLDQMIGIVTASVVVVYIMYVIAPDVEAKLGSENLWMSAPFVLYGVFRYLYLVHMQEKGGSPTRLLLTDPPLLINVVLWLVSVGVILYWV